MTVDLKASAHEDEDEIGGPYAGLRPEKHEVPMWELLKSFSQPTFISLDRTISAESEDVYYVEEKSQILRRRVRSQSPIVQVQDVTSSKYADFRAKAIANDNELKAQIVMSALQSPEVAFRGDVIKPITHEEIAQLEAKVSTYLSTTIKSADVSKQVHRFFRASRLFTERQDRAKREHDLGFYFVAAQYRQIEGLAKAFNDFENKNAQAFKALNDYLTTVNHFFNDSRKELFFDETTGKLLFTVIETAEKKRVGKSVAYLSSGERQILVLFTFLAFASNPKSVFIVDEPELSLHPKWQAEFMDAFLRLRPEETQLVLATHSPDIVGKYKSQCVALRASQI
jgi:predicted ATP-dependent endonuclease of OLD family